MSACYVTARFQALPGKGEQLAEALAPLIPLVRAEEGCLRYDLHRQSDNPESLLFYEVWASPAQLQQHSQGANMAAIQQVAQPLRVAEPEIRVWSAVDVF